MTVATLPWRQRLTNWLTKYLYRVSTVNRMLFVHNLHIMLKAGLSVVEACGILSEQIPNRRLKTIITEVKAQIEKGRQLSEVLADFPTVFPPIYVHMIAAGETAGTLEQALAEVYSQMKKTYELMSHVRGALIYPAVILVAMAGIGIEMVVFVLPKIIVLFNDFNAALPLPTRVLIAVVTFMEHYAWAVLLAAVLLAAGAVALIQRPRVRHMVHRLNLHLPIAGTIIKKINLARFTLTLSSLLSSTIPIIDAVRITASVQGNLMYQEALLAVAEALKKGQALSELLAQSPKLFPPMVVQMVLVGEQSGEVEHMLQELSDYYSGEVDTTMKNFSTIIEPVIIIILGLAVAGIAVAVIMPMYSLAESF